MQKLINHYNFFCPTIHSSSYHTKTTVRPSAIKLGKVAKKQGCPSHYQGRISTKNPCFKFNYSLLCLVFGGKCKMWPRDIVSPCVTSASRRRRESRAYGEIAYKRLMKKKTSAFPITALSHGRNSPRTQGESGVWKSREAHRERAMKAFIHWWRFVHVLSQNKKHEQKLGFWLALNLFCLWRYGSHLGKVFIFASYLYEDSCLFCSRLHKMILSYQLKKTGLDKARGILDELVL